MNKKSRPFHGRLHAVRAQRLEALRYLLNSVGFDRIANIEVGEVLRTNAALLSLPHFSGIVLEALERSDQPFEENIVAALDADAGLGSR